MEGAQIAKMALTQASTPNYGATTFENDGVEEDQSTVFPFEPFRCLPQGLVMLFPRPWTKIVSVPHLVLLIANIASIAVLVDTVASWKVQGCFTYYCQGRVVPLVFVAMCIVYFFTTIQQYDDVLQHKQKELQSARHALDQRYKDMIGDLEGFLSKALESQVMLAERGFESHRRDFTRFLQKYNQRLTDPDATGGAQVACDGALLVVFRSFAKRWLGYFSECSIDPVNHPLEVISQEEVEKCKNVVEVAELVSGRLDTIEVQFVSSQREKDKAELSRIRTSWTNKYAIQQRMNAFLEAVCGRIPTFHKKVMDPENGTAQTFSNGGDALTFSNDLAQDPSNETTDTYRWVRWGRSESLGMKREEASSCFPFELHLGFVTIILLSGDHIRLIIGFFMGVAVLAMECMMFHVKTLHTVFVETIVCLVCIVFILHEFLDMDIIAQLDGQLRELEAEQLRALQKREKIMEFYTSAQELGEVWLHHTLPLLEMMKCFYEGLRDVRIENHMDIMSGMDKELEALGQSAPPLAQWRGDSIVSSKNKKAFDAAITQLVSKNSNNKELVASMPQCSRDIRVAFGLEVAAAPLPALPALAEKPKTIVEGCAAEYFSTSRLGRWIPALVLRIDPDTGLIDLDCRKQVEPNKVRLPRPEEEQKAACNQQ